jgi:DNA-binding NarL/FixJ family response regulator
VTAATFLYPAEVILKLLIVDDNTAIRRLVRSLVAPLASRVCECADGAGALAAYITEKPDVVLMDIRMDGVDGIQATKQIRSADPSATIVIVTNFDDEELRQAAMRAGASGYILKENLLELVRLLEAYQDRGE